ncbi:uncharacterized protein LOC128884158 isoform X2 [Hylaeus volcanicus]|uniref:uncharacterized protein LOC128884158 isoform X2 n=1 Tax=Hylaeus volcanicus TaxID=313075 RepID=UPI0023B80E3C|nr:uncharacterized protein LOC128884158 isoform X2 [Hylaeus volcanicus]
MLLKAMKDHRSNELFCEKYPMLFGTQPVYTQTDIDQENSSIQELYDEKIPRWETIEIPAMDFAPLFLSCTTKAYNEDKLIGITSLEKNRFSELVTFDMKRKKWSPCTRTRHFRPPKRIGSAAVATENHLFLFGGYELNNQEVKNKGSKFFSSDSFCFHSSFEEIRITEKSSTISWPSLTRLFGYPDWWFTRFGDLQYRNINATPHLVDALGDFHAYDLCRGEWNPIITRDNKPVSNVSNNSPYQPWMVRVSSYKKNRNSIQPIKYIPASRGSHHIVSGNTLNDSLPTPRAFHTLIRHGNILVLFGGEKSNQCNQFLVNNHVEHQLFSVVSYFNDVWIFDLQEMRWMMKINNTYTLNTDEESLKQVKNFLNKCPKQIQPFLRDNPLQCVCSHQDKSEESICDICSTTTQPFCVDVIEPSPSIHSGKSDNDCDAFHHNDQLNRDCSFLLNQHMNKFSHSKIEKPHGTYHNKKLENYHGFHVPSPRSGHCVMVYKNYMYMHGGQNSQGLLGDMWVLSLETFEWKQVETSGESPGLRAGHTAVVTDNYAWVYGGITHCEYQKRQNDLKLFNPSETVYANEFVVPSYDECSNEARFKHYPTTIDDQSPTKEKQEMYYHFISQNLFEQLRDTLIKRQKTVESSAFVSDSSNLFCFNFEFLHWEKYTYEGVPPLKARQFGRLHGFFHKNFLCFGGCTGVDLKFQLSLIHIPCTTILCNNVSNLYKIGSPTENHSIVNLPRFLDIFFNCEDKKQAPCQHTFWNYVEKEQEMYCDKTQQLESIDIDNFNIPSLLFSPTPVDLHDTLRHPKICFGPLSSQYTATKHTLFYTDEINNNLLGTNHCNQESFLTEMDMLNKDNITSLCGAMHLENFKNIKLSAHQDFLTETSINISPLLTDTMIPL